METERLILDPLRESDKEDYYTHISHDREVLKTFICRYAESMEEFDFSSYPGREDLFAIRLKETDRLIGILSLFDEKDGSCEIGYGIGSAFWNQGYATEAVKRFLDYLFLEKGFQKVYASFFTGNDASRRVMEKCGMSYSHLSEKELIYLDVPRDLVYYAITDTERDNRSLIRFWDQALSLSEIDLAELEKGVPESLEELAPSQKLYEAVCSLGKRKKVLDFGCGNAWAGILAAKSGCPDVTAADAAPGAVRTAECFAVAYGVERNLHAVCLDSGWLRSIPAGTYDGLFCSNVLDVIPTETALEIVREFARITTPDADVLIGLNYYLSPDAAAKRRQDLAEGNRLYVDGILRLVSRTDEEWAEFFSPWFTVEKRTHFAWPGEKAETRRLFYLKKR